jgi:methylmalonyl-CoA mutase cobalamin-binding domain/chain
VDRLEALTNAIVELEEAMAVQLTQELLDEGTSHTAILQACSAGMGVVGERYERQEYFLSALIVAGEVFKNVLDLVNPELSTQRSSLTAGRVLIGTVEGDIHDLGKSIVTTALSGFGFTVVDLGVDVSPERFLKEAQAFEPDVVGLSGLLIPASVEAMRETVHALKSEVLRAGRPMSIVVGGNVDETVARFVGADSWTTDAMEGVRICQRFIKTQDRGVRA